VYFLDEFVEDIGFKARQFPADRIVISPHSIVVLDPQSKPDAINALVSKLKISVWRYELDPRNKDSSDGDLYLIPAGMFQMTVSQLNGLFKFCKDTLEKDGFTVMTYQEYTQKFYSDKNKKAPNLSISNRFSELAVPEGQQDEEDD
jgi:hypothetical protein